LRRLLRVCCGHDRFSTRNPSWTDRRRSWSGSIPSALLSGPLWGSLPCLSRPSIASQASTSFLGSWTV
jgi:hypothetical protein